MYTQIEGYLSAEDAADELVRHARLVAASIKEGAPGVAGVQLSGVQALVDLLNKYTAQKPQ